jgi:alcohol dehydrogenase (NADP+)
MFMGNACFFGGSKIGSKKEAMEMLDLAARKGIKPWYA